MFLNGIGSESKLTSEDLKQLSSLTDKYSGSDINIVIRDALMQPIRKVQMATHFKKISSSSSQMTPCSPSDSGAIEMSWMSLQSNQLVEPLLVMSDILRSLSKAKSSVSPEDIQRYVRFTNEFGEDG